MEQWAKHMIFKKKVSRWTVNSIFNSSEVPWGAEWWCFCFCRKWSFFILDLTEMGTTVKIAVSFLTHIRTEIGAFKYKGKDLLGSNPLLFHSSWSGKKRKSWKPYSIFFCLPNLQYISEKLPSASFITCLIPSHAPTSLHLFWVSHCA